MNTLDTAVIIAGGNGLRLGSDTLDKPKAMVRLLERPIIDWIIFWLKKNGVRTIIIGVDYKKEVLMEHLGDGRALGVKVLYNDHHGASETGDAFRSALERHDLPETFLALNGDQITDLRVKEMWAAHQRYNPIATIATCPVRIPYGIPSINDDSTIEMFREKPVLHDTFMSTGIYIFNKDILAHLPQQGSLEKETFTKLAQLKKLRAYKHRGFFTTINDQKELVLAQELLRDLNPKLL